MSVLHTVNRNNTRMRHIREEAARRHRRHDAWEDRHDRRDDDREEDAWSRNREYRDREEVDRREDEDYISEREAEEIQEYSYECVDDFLAPGVNTDIDYWDLRHKSAEELLEKNLGPFFDPDFITDRQHEGYDLYPLQLIDLYQKGEITSNKVCEYVKAYLIIKSKNKEEIQRLAKESKYKSLYMNLYESPWTNYKYGWVSIILHILAGIDYR